MLVLPCRFTCIKKLTFSWWIVPFNHMMIFISCFLLFFFDLKSILSDVRMANTHFLLDVILLVYHLPSPHTELMFVLTIEVSFLKAAYLVLFCFLIHSFSVCLLTGEFNAFILRVIIDKWGFSVAVFLPSHYSRSPQFLFLCASVHHFSLEVLYDILLNSLFLCFLSTTLDFCFVVATSFT